MTLQSPCRAGTPQEPGRKGAGRGPKRGRQSRYGAPAMSFRAVGLPLSPFEPLFALGDAELAARGMRRMIVDEKPGFPCRVTLEDAEPGERADPAAVRAPARPFALSRLGPDLRARGRARAVRRGRRRAAGPARTAAVRCAAMTARTASSRPMSSTATMRSRRSRGSSHATMSRYIHVHNAKRGCFACRIERT